MLHDEMAQHEAPPASQGAQARGLDHRTTGRIAHLYHPERDQFCTFAYHPSKELWPGLVAKIAKETGLRPEDL
jgi:HicA toxin of bacterial toxin-antitoxin,